MMWMNFRISTTKSLSALSIFFFLCKAFVHKFYESKNLKAKLKDISLMMKVCFEGVLNYYSVNARQSFLFAMTIKYNRVLRVFFWEDFEEKSLGFLRQFQPTLYVQWLEHKYLTHTAITKSLHNSMWEHI